MSVSCELAAVKDELQNHLENKDCHQIKLVLESLHSKKISLHDLKESHIGAVVNKIRKSNLSDDISKISLDLIKEWKAELLSNQIDLKQDQKKSSIDDQSRKEKTIHEQSVSERPSPSSVYIKQNKSEVRDKFVSMLIEALKFKNEILKLSKTEDQISEIADAIESEIFLKFGLKSEISSKYKSDIRSRIINIKDKNNHLVAEKILTDEITPSLFANTQIQDLASDDIKQKRIKLEEESINNRRISRPPSVKSAVLKCPKCKKNNCSYQQLQTRSSDEPMTNFCYC